MVFVTHKEKKDTKHETHPKKEKHKDEKQEKIEELTQSLKRVQADFQNYKKRVEKQQKDMIVFAGEKIIQKLLPTIDNLELALKHAKQKDEFYQGIELVYAGLREALKTEGLEDIEAVGMPFDPYRHEALLSQESDKEPNTVLEEMQKGYTLKDKILRPAKVIVSKPKLEENKNE